MKTRVALIHATKVAIQPIEDAFIQLWPEAERMNLLDDSLAADRARCAEFTPEIIRRFVTLAQYAKDAGAAGILYTCSSFGPAIEAAKAAVGIPVLKPNEAMFLEAMQSGSRIGMVTTFAPAAEPMQVEFDEMAAGLRKSVELYSVAQPEALAALQAGDAATHDRLVAEAAHGLGECDVVMLGQFSMARALDATRALVKVPVLTSPGCAVRMLRTAVEQAAV